MKKITTLLLALLLVIPAMAHDLSSGSIMYFNKPSTWTASTVQFMIGHSSWSQGYAMSKITNTNLYYVSMSSWGGYTQWAIFNTSGTWGGGDHSVEHRKSYADNSTSVGTTALGTRQLINEDGTFASLTSYTSLNHTQTVEVEGEGTIEMSSYILSGNKATTASSGETTVSAAYTATVTCTATAADGYQFIGWYNGEESLSSSTTYSYTAENADKTITAKFEQLTAETPVLSNFTVSATEIELGNTVTFSCDIENGDVANIVYTVGGEAIEGNTWAPTEIGTYTVAATYEGAVSLTSEVSVYAEPSIESGELAVFFDNTESQWSTVMAYVWDGSSGNNGWPGEAMTYLGNNMYKYTCTQAFTPIKVVFNNGNEGTGNQTGDLEWVNGGVYSYSSTTPDDVISPQDVITLAVSPTEIYTGDTVSFSAYYNEEYYAGYELTFEVNGVAQAEATWTPDVAGNYAIVAVLTQGENVARSEQVDVTVAESTEFYVYLMKEGAWETTYIYYWGNASNTWPGTQLSETETIDGVEYYKTIFRNVETVSIIFNNNSGSQTSDITGVTETMYYRITNQEGGDGSYEASETPFVVEQSETLVFTVTVPTGTTSVNIAGSFNEWSAEATPMTLVEGETNVWTVTIDNLVKSSVSYKYVTNSTWENVEVADENDAGVANRTYNENDTVYKWKGINLYYEENIVCETLWYLDTNNLWDADNAWFAAYFFNKNTGAYTWVKGELLETGYYTFYLSQYNVPENAVARAKTEDAPVYTHVIFCRMNPEFNVMAWDETEVVENGDGTTTTNVTVDRVWNQTADLTYNGTESNALSTFQITDADGNGTWINLPTAIEGVETANGIGYAYGIVSAEGAIEVYNVGGVVVARGNDNVDLRGLNGGVYIVRNGNNVRKVVR